MRKLTFAIWVLALASAMTFAQRAQRQEPVDPEIGKLVIETKVNNAVAEINKLIGLKVSSPR